MALTWPYIRADSIVVHRTNDQARSHVDRSQCGRVAIALRIGVYRLVVLASLRFFACLLDAIGDATDSNQCTSG
jgi:hypothetical protein